MVFTSILACSRLFCRVTLAGTYIVLVTRKTNLKDAHVSLKPVNPIASSLGARLRNMRRSQNQPQGELAQKAEIAASTLSHFEAGRRVPNLKQIYRLATALDVSIDFLLGRTNDAISHISFRSDFEQWKLSGEDLQLLRTIADRLVAAIPPDATFPRCLHKGQEKVEAEEWEAAASEAQSLENEVPKKQ